MSALGIAIARAGAVTTVTALVAATKHFPGDAPQNIAPPYLTFNLVSESDEQILEGPGGYFNSRVTIACIGLSLSSANTIGEALKGLQVTKQTIATKTDVDIVKAEFDETDSSDDRMTFRRVMDFYIRWR